jgi:hypothetical protein
MGAGLLTGDRNLRELAQMSGIEVHGTLWLLEELMTHRLITFTQASTGLDAMRRAGSRLPVGEVLGCLRRWERSK